MDDAEREEVTALVELLEAQGMKQPLKSPLIFGGEVWFTEISFHGAAFIFILTLSSPLRSLLHASQ